MKPCPVVRCRPLLTRHHLSPITTSPQDIYVPALPTSSDREGELKPVLFFVYGGGWKRGKRRNWFGLCGNVDIIFDVILDHFSRTSQLHTTPYAPRAMLYFVPVLIGG